MMRQDDTIQYETGMMGRPPKAIKLQDPIGIRFTEDQLTRIDKLLKAGRDAWPVVGVHNRNDLIRYLVQMALETVEREAPIHGFPKRRR